MSDRRMRRLLILTTITTALLLVWSNSAGNELTASCVVLSPLNITLQPGESAQVTATAYDELGNVIPGARIAWLPHPDDPAEHCVSVAGGVVTARAVGTCSVGALSVTPAGRLILHQAAVSVTVSEPVPSPTRDPCRLPNGKCKRGCICR